MKYLVFFVVLGSILVFESVIRFCHLLGLFDLQRTWS